MSIVSSWLKWCNNTTLLGSVVTSLWWGGIWKCYTNDFWHRNSCFTCDSLCKLVHIFQRHHKIEPVSVFWTWRDMRKKKAAYASDKSRLSDHFLPQDYQSYPPNLFETRLYSCLFAQKTPTHSHLPHTGNLLSDEKVADSILLLLLLWVLASEGWREAWQQYIFQNFCFEGVMDKLGVQDFRSAWLELINIGICSLINKAISA